MSGTEQLTEQTISEINAATDPGEVRAILGRLEPTALAQIEQAAEARQIGRAADALREAVKVLKFQLSDLVGGNGNELVGGDGGQSVQFRRMAPASGSR